MHDGAFLTCNALHHDLRFYEAFEYGLLYSNSLGMVLHNGWWLRGGHKRVNVIATL
jgi:hypothetical protein